MGIVLVGVVGVGVGGVIGIGMGITLFVGVVLGIEVWDVFFVVGAAEECDYLGSIFRLVVEEQKVLLSLALWVGLYKHLLHRVGVDACVVHLGGERHGCGREILYLL